MFGNQASTSKRIALIPHVGSTKAHLLRAIALQRMLSESYETLLVIPERAREFCDAFFPGLKCKWIPWNFGHTEMSQSRFTEIVKGSNTTAAEITRIFDDFNPALVIGLPGFYTSLLCRLLGVPHVAVLHGSWIAPEYDLQDLNKDEKLVLDKCGRLFEIVDVIAKVVSHAAGYRYGGYRDWLEKEIIWIGQDFDISYKTKRPKVGFLSTSFGPTFLEETPNKYLSVCFGTAIRGVPRELLLAMSGNPEPLLVVSESEPETVTRLRWTRYLQSACLAKISLLTISHAGVSSVGEFAASGVPQVFFPHDIDQAVISMLASRSGLGSSIDLGYWRKRTPFGRVFPRFDPAELHRLIRRERTKRVATRPRLNDRSLLEEALKELHW